MKIIYIILLTILASCSHHHKETAHHHHENGKEMDKALNVAFEKKCAHSVMEGDSHVEGNPDFKIEHEGHLYYFSSQAKMDVFNSNLKKNALRAQKSWRRGQQR